jgi:hypothetical protein
VTRRPHVGPAVAADLRGGDSRTQLGELPKKGAHGGNMVSPVLVKEVLGGDRAGTA